MKKLMILGVLLAGLLVLSACGGEEPVNTTDTGNVDPGDNQQVDDGENNSQADPVDNYVVEIDVQDFGVITVELGGTAAPVTVTNFVNLVEEGFYDGLTFHRVISGFMVQGGDPLGNGTGGSENNILGEFPKNGVDNNLDHTRGAISMARSRDFDSASSQFFIVHKDSPHLNGEYAAFGYVTDGIEVVDAICAAEVVFLDNNGMVAPEDQPVITSIRIIE